MANTKSEMTLTGAKCLEMAVMGSHPASQRAAILRAWGTKIEEEQGYTSDLAAWLGTVEKALVAMVWEDAVREAMEAGTAQRRSGYSKAAHNLESG